MADLTQARLKELFTYDAATGKFARLRSTSSRAPAGTVETTLTPYGYRRLQVDGQRHYEHKLVWLYVHGRWPRGDVDHINCDKADNRISNLREATRSENKQNVGLMRTNKSGFKGVCWDASRQKWMAAIRANGRVHNLGRFDCPRAAGEAYARAAKGIFGEFARTS